MRYAILDFEKVNVPDVEDVFAFVLCDSLGLALYQP